MLSTSEIADIFTTWDKIFLVFTEKKYIFFYFFPLRVKLTVLWSFLVNFAWLSVLSGCNIRCKRSFAPRKCVIMSF